jgi:hypothetical protein
MREVGAAQSTHALPTLPAGGQKPRPPSVGMPQRTGYPCAVWFTRTKLIPRGLGAEALLQYDRRNE